MSPGNDWRDDDREQSRNAGRSSSDRERGFADRSDEARYNFTQRGGQQGRGGSYSANERGGRNADEGQGGMPSRGEFGDARYFGNQQERFADSDDDRFEGMGGRGRGGFGGQSNIGGEFGGGRSGGNMGGRQGGYDRGGESESYGGGRGNQGRGRAGGGSFDDGSYGNGSFGGSQMGQQGGGYGGGFGGYGGSGGSAREGGSFLSSMGQQGGYSGQQGRSGGSQGMSGPMRGGMGAQSGGDRDWHAQGDGWQGGSEGMRHESSGGGMGGSRMQSGGMSQSSHVGKGPKGWQRSDDRIREDVNEALARHPEVDASEIEVQVSGGEITLSGTVAQRADKRVAEEIAEQVFGVSDVQNQLRVKKAEGMESKSGDKAGEQRMTESRMTPDAADASKGNKKTAGAPGGAMGGTSGGQTGGGTSGTPGAATS